MPIFNSQQLLQDLDRTVRHGIQQINSLSDKADSELKKSGPDNSWSALQHLHHLNFYADFYTTAIENCLDQARSQSKITFRSGWLGNYFANIIGPAADQAPVKMKMKSPPNAIPPESETLVPAEVIETCIGFQHRILLLLQRARQVDLGGHRVPTSLSNFIRLKLGDTFRFLIAHQERHLQHLERAAILEPTAQ